MTELDPTILERLLPPVPGSPDWEDVMRRSIAFLRRHLLGWSP